MQREFFKVKVIYFYIKNSKQVATLLKISVKRLANNNCMLKCFVKINEIMELYRKVTIH